MQTFIKDPDSTLDYTFDWSDWLQEGENITNASVETESGLTETSEGFNTTAVTVWVKGGTVGESYEVTCEITTDNSPARIDQRTILITVQER